MRHHETPEIGHWYQFEDNNQIFEVVAADDIEQYVEVQYFSGEIEEFDSDTWFELPIVNIPAPEDWSGPFELSKEDYSYSDEAIHPEDWSGPLSDLEPDEPF